MNGGGGPLDVAPEDGLPPRPDALSPAPLLLLTLVVGLGLALAAMFFLGRSTDAGIVEIGPVTALASRADAGPVPLAALPHLVVTKSRTDAPVYDVAYGFDDGTILLDPNNQLVVLAVSDPVDGATLTWCRSNSEFEHPEGLRSYDIDGELLRGDGRRGMDRRGIAVVGGGEVQIDDSRWVSGSARGTKYDGYVRRGPSCLD